DAEETVVGTDPLDPSSVSTVRLGYWRFDNTNTWVGDAGQLPLAVASLYGIASWNTNAVVVSGSRSTLKYRDVESNGKANINLRAGTLRFWFKPAWSSTNAGGVGPGGDARLLDVGGFGTANGWWGMAIGSMGTNLYFGTQTNSIGTLGTNLTA